MQLVGGKRDSYQLMCTRANSRAGCEGARVACRVAERALIDDLLSPRHLLAETSVATLAASVAIRRIQGELDDARDARDRLIRLALATGHIGEIARRITAAEAEVSEGLARLAAQKKASTPRRSGDLTKARHLCTALTASHATAEERSELREALRPLTTRLFSSVRFHPSLQEIELHYESGDRVVVTYDKMPCGFQKGHGGLARWGRRSNKPEDTSDFRIIDPSMEGSLIGIPGNAPSSVG